MSLLHIRGGHPLKGVVRVHGAKNSVLPILAATFLIPGVTVLENCPDLTDVSATLEILKTLGCQVSREGDRVTVDARHPTGWSVPDGLMEQLRSSILFLGPVTGRLGQAELSLPGGCELGPRPIDLHLSLLRQMGGELSLLREEGGRFRCRGALKGTDLVLPYPSVGATENAILGAVYAEGVTTITNPAREPELRDLQNFLNQMGASVHGAGTSVITVEGVESGSLHGGIYTVMGDRIEAATYLCALAATGGEGEVRGFGEDSGLSWRQLAAVTSVLSEAGCTIRSEDGFIFLRAPERLKAVRPIRTAPYPGFPTDAQAVMMAALSAADGVTLMTETVFDSRFRHVDDLNRMGAEIRLISGSRTAAICGVPRLRGAAVTATDLRGGAALVVAGLGAEGLTELSGLAHLDRGYAGLLSALGGLGADISRIQTEIIPC